MMTALVAPPTSPARVVGVSLWRAFVAVLAWLGVWLGLGGASADSALYWLNLALFTQVCGLLVALTATGSLLWPLWHGGALEGRRAYFRGASAACSMLTLVVFATLLGADYGTLHSLLLHLLVPLLALVDWLFVGRNQTALPVWMPVAWMALPFAYLPIYIWASGLTGPLYGFLIPGDPTFVPIAAVLVVAFLVLFFAYWGLGRLRGRLTRTHPHPIAT